GGRGRRGLSGARGLPALGSARRDGTRPRRMRPASPACPVLGMFPCLPVHSAITAECPMLKVIILIVLITFLLPACAAPRTGARAKSEAARPLRFAIALHGGAGVIDRDTPEPERREYEH